MALNNFTLSLAFTLVVFIVSHYVHVFPFHKWFSMLYLPVLQVYLVAMRVGLH